MRTRKTVTFTIVATFEGDYIPANQAFDYLEEWIDGGLADRDDLKGWETTSAIVTEEPVREEES
ncbi:hypothetical protein [Streptomyces johnsoniae]|uniref:Uncharacterized protein n=1 Tax=Streptomyces johnsoniae TaxID=3075532 RepID=A0ABU2S1M1_9ACTN|nr:hypothetical protein [Streptomyces sp. DSM 41886]MDT0442339.1 hypothetical protein [Streptomyces sp. DSM 41886]